MKKLKATLRAAALSSIVISAVPVAGAQDLTDPTTTVVNRDDDSGKWGLLGLVGLLGLMGLKRRDHDNRPHTTTGR